MRCKQNYVLVSYKEKFPLCYECQKTELSKKIKDPEMKKFFDIPEEFYKKSLFLRNIKIFYITHQQLSEKQISAFKTVLDKIKADEKAKKALAKAQEE